MRGPHLTQLPDRFLIAEGKTPPIGSQLRLFQPPILVERHNVLKECDRGQVWEKWPADAASLIVET
jgi:hypothetical protein